MADKYDGAELSDAAGEHVGTVERTYLDDLNTPRFVQVKIGHLLGKHRLAPVDQAEWRHGALQVPYTKDTIEESPSVDPGDTLEGVDLESVRSYYASESEEDAADSDQGAARRRVEVVDSGEGSSVDTSDERSKPHQVRDLGEVVEIPIVEEVLVKKPVVREVLRVRKTPATEEVTAAADLRREDVEVEPSTSGLVRGEGNEEG